MPIFFSNQKPFLHIVIFSQVTLACTQTQYTIMLRVYQAWIISKCTTFSTLNSFRRSNMQCMSFILIDLGYIPLQNDHTYTGHIITTLLSNLCFLSSYNLLYILIPFDSCFVCVHMCVCIVCVFKSQYHYQRIKLG